MDFSQDLYVYCRGSSHAPMPLNRETTGTTGNIFVMAVSICGAMEGGGSANLQPSGELSRKILFLITFLITG